MSIAQQRCQLVFQKLERDLSRLAAKPHPENVHSFRTTTGRLRVLLEELVPERTNNQKKLLKALGRIRRRAGRIRDLDVQLATLRSLRFAQDPRRKTELTQALIELRGEHEKKLRKLLTKEAVREIHARLKRTAKKTKMKTEDLTNPLATARKILHRVALPAAPVNARPVAPSVTEDVLHKLRIAVKRARYAAEFAPKSVEAGQFIAQLKRLQDTLGSWHDWLTLTHAASDRFGDLRESAMVAAVNNVTRGKFRQAVAAVAAAFPTPRPVAAPERPRKPAAKPQAPRRDSAA